MIREQIEKQSVLIFRTNKMVKLWTDNMKV